MTLSFSDDEEKESEDERIDHKAFVASRRHDRITFGSIGWNEEILGRQVIVCSLGLTNFEKTSYCTGASDEYRRYVGYYDAKERKERPTVNLDDDEEQTIFLLPVPLQGQGNHPDRLYQVCT